MFGLAAVSTAFMLIGFCCAAALGNARQAILNAFALALNIYCLKLWGKKLVTPQ